jgi:hypothetical protein
VDVNPESLDTPHFTDPKLFDWLFADEVLDLIEPRLGPDIALSQVTSLPSRPAPDDACRGMKTRHTGKR